LSLGAGIGMQSNPHDWQMQINQDMPQVTLQEVVVPAAHIRIGVITVVTQVKIGRFVAHSARKVIPALTGNR